MEGVLLSARPPAAEVRLQAEGAPEWEPIGEGGMRIVLRVLKTNCKVDNSRRETSAAVLHRVGALRDPEGVPPEEAPAGASQGMVVRAGMDPTRVRGEAVWGQTPVLRDRRVGAVPQMKADRAAAGIRVEGAQVALLPAEGSGRPEES